MLRKKPVAPENQEGSCGTAGSTEAHSVGTSDERQNPEQALHCCIMGCGLRRPLTSSSL